jgi:hypothetical protein
MLYKKHKQKWKNVKVKFEAFDKETELLFDPPKPAVQALPEWYKNMPTRMDNEKVDGLSKDGVAVSNLTLKGCSPFLDALSTGYIFELPFDLEFRFDSKRGINVRWATNVNFISTHGAEQAPGLPVPFGGEDGLLKWRPGWRVVTPKGYSCLFTHPINRHDLPFRTFSGVVDTDMYKLGVEFPFQLLTSIKQDIFILEKGTPICQVLPFKRDNWDSSILEFDEKENKKQGFLLKSKIVRSYKQQFWQKKVYK